MVLVVGYNGPKSSQNCCGLYGSDRGGKPFAQPWLLYRYALWLDEELSRGISRTSATFGNDSLSSKEEFLIGAVELWWLS